MLGLREKNGKFKDRIKEFFPMQATVLGVKIKLTEAQISEVRKELRRIEKCRHSFKKMLVRFGFKELKDLPGSFVHKGKNWYAEIRNQGAWEDVWMTGSGLKSSSFPGGWIYSEPKEIEEEILNYLKTTNN